MSNCDFYHLNNTKKCAENYHRLKGFKKLIDCKSNTDSHMRQIGVLSLNEENNVNEKDLIILRLGLEQGNTKFDAMDICPVHRSTLGISWRSSSKCSYISHSTISTVKSPKFRVNLEMAKKINRYKNKSNIIFYPLGSKFCHTCFTKLKSDLNMAENNFKREIQTNPPVVSRPGN